MAISKREAGMDGNSPKVELRGEVPIDVGCITEDELAGWLKLVDLQQRHWLDGGDCDRPGECCLDAHRSACRSNHY